MSTTAQNIDESIFKPAAMPAMTLFIQCRNAVLIAPVPTTSHQRRLRRFTSVYRQTAIPRGQEMLRVNSELATAGPQHKYIEQVRPGRTRTNGNENICQPAETDNRFHVNKSARIACLPR